MTCPKTFRQRRTERQALKRAQQRRKKAAGYQPPSDERMAEIRANAEKERQNSRATAVLNIKEEPPRTVTRDKQTGRVIDVQPQRRFRTGPMSRGSQAIQSERQKLMEKGLLIK